MTVQHSMGLEMEYFGGQTSTVTADSTIAATLQFNLLVIRVVVFNEASVSCGNIGQCFGHAN